MTERLNWTELSLLIDCSQHSCWKSFDCTWKSLFLGSPFYSIGLYVCLIAITTLLGVNDSFIRDFLVAQMVKNLPEMQETRVRSLGQEDRLEKGMAIHSSILAWRIPWTEKAGGLQFVGVIKSQTCSFIIRKCETSKFVLFSRLFWLSRVHQYSVWIFGWVFKFLFKMLGFWEGLH